MTTFGIPRYYELNEVLLSLRIRLSGRSPGANECPGIAEAANRAIESLWYRIRTEDSGIIRNHCRGEIAAPRR